jgi:hypothetical protein
MSIAFRVGQNFISSYQSLLQCEPWCTMWMWSTLGSYRVVEKTPI